MGRHETVSIPSRLIDNTYTSALDLLEQVKQLYIT